MEAGYHSAPPYENPFVQIQITSCVHQRWCAEKEGLLEFTILIGTRAEK